jgi:DNA-directed RNA polymerase specialized sigma24 family protein
VRGVLAELSGRVSACSYQILHLRWIEGRPLPEIAAALGLTPAQVRFRHHRVKQKFRRLFVERSNGTALP